MFKNNAAGGPALRAGLTIACFALMAGVAHAQDVVIDDGALLVDPAEVIDPEWIAPEPIYNEDGEEIIWLNDGIGDGVPLDDGVPVDTGDGIGDGLPLEGEVTPTGEYPQSTCDGCEYEFEVGGPEVQRSLTTGTDDALSTGDVVRNDTNICFDAALYVPLLCDWQRPFVGDRMP